MIVKELEVPLTIPKLQALLGRIPFNHPKTPLIRSDLQRKLAGYHGEKSLAFPLSFLPEKDYFILHDLRLFDGKHYFQIDVLILSKIFALILEVKNYAGELCFDNVFKQLIRKKEGRENVFPYPLTQLLRIETQMRKWLEPFCNIPLYSAVVLSNPSSLIRTNSPLHHKVITQDFIPFYISQITQTNLPESVDTEVLKKMIKQLKKKNTPLDLSIMDKYQITREEIQKGIRCPNCNHLPLSRINANWYCPRCEAKCKNGHLRALVDYYYLFGLTITNPQARDFLQIESAALVTRLMLAAKIKSKGVKKRK